MKPIYSESAERVVLGATLLDNGVWHSVIAILCESDFYVPRHRTIFGAMVRMFDRQEVVDTVTLAGHIGSDGMNRIGGVEALDVLEEAVATSATVDHFAKIVLKKSIVRQVVATAVAIQCASQDEDLDIVEYLQDTRESILKVTGALAAKSAPKRIGENMSELVNEIISGRTPGIIPTGFSALDRIFGGLWCGLLHVVGGTPGMGKSAFLLNLATNFGLANRKVLYCSLEDAISFQQRRLLARMANINLQKLILSKVTEEEGAGLVRAMVRAEKLPVWIYDNQMTMAQVSQMAIGMMEKDKLDLLIIDHLGWVQQGGKDEYERFSATVRQSADLAKTLDIPVVMGSQLNRKVLERKPPIPMLGDFRGSGNIEADIRVAIGLYRPYETTRDISDLNELQVHILKCTHSHTGQVKLFCDMSRMWIKDRHENALDYDDKMPAQEELGYNA